MSESPKENLSSYQQEKICYLHEISLMLNVIAREMQYLNGRLDECMITVEKLIAESNKRKEVGE